MRVDVNRDNTQLVTLQRVTQLQFVVLPTQISNEH